MPGFFTTEARRHGGRIFFLLCVGLFFASSCSKRERTDPNAEEWADIQALADDAVPEVQVSTNTAAGVIPEIGEEIPDSEFQVFVDRLAEMKSIERKAGETLLTGKMLVFDYDKRYVLMNKDVRVVDDDGELETDRLVGRFSVSNEVEYIEAKNGVVIRSEGREAQSEQAVYSYADGLVTLEGRATVSEGGNSLSGESIRFWIDGNRKMICEPNALLVVSGESGLALDGVSSENSDEETEIRADKVIYDESQGMAQLDGNVRVRDPRAAMNCKKVNLFLKDDNEIDWIEALGEVIIQSDDRKALAKKATYHADEGKFTLEGMPMVKQGLNVMTGDRIIFWHETRRMVCEPNARVLLYLDEETKAKFLKDLDE